MENKSHNIEAMKHGLTIGLAYTAALFALYLLGHDVFFGATRAVVYIVVWAAIIYFAVQLRKGNGDNFSFGDAFLVIMLMYASAELVWHIGNYIVFNFVDTDLSNVAKSISIDKTREMMEKFGTPEDKIDEVMEMAEKESYAITLAKSLQSIGIYMILGLIIGALSALGVRKGEPKSVF